MGQGCPEGIGGADAKRPCGIGSRGYCNVRNLWRRRPPGLDDGDLATSTPNSLFLLPSLFLTARRVSGAARPGPQSAGRGLS